MVRYLPSTEHKAGAQLRTRGEAACETARRLGRSPSTNSRELHRNASTRSYRLDPP
ncbi:helix-turn-helix domain-containing protein [Nocardia sp. 852002-20019_SCH5090214]|uniref:helix-turn-helix domain-containing protein n=1 Tax=Nocardia sp. 852002-20019_SCH5090214 TaxID=1834087 RepID=UPI0009EE3B47